MLRASRLFPFSLIVIMAAVSFWLDSISRIEEVQSELDPSKPEYVITGVKAKRFDQQGYLQDFLVAQKLWQYPKSDDIYLSHPNVDVYQSGILKYQLSSLDGQYNNKNKQAYFEKQVMMMKPEDAERLAAKVTTTKLHIDTVNGIASSKERVDFSYGLSKGSAVGFSYNQKTGYLSLNSRVSARYEVQKQP